MAKDETGGVWSRKSFRFPGSDKQEILLMVNEKCYELADIGSNGAGVLIEDKTELGDVGDMITITLRYGDTKIEIVCRIVHICADEENAIRCGLEFSPLDDDMELKLFECLNLNRESYFSGF